MDQPKLQNVYENNRIFLSIENINLYVLVFCISIQSCKDCQTVQTIYTTRINFRILLNTFLILGWFIKTKYLLYFKNILPKLRFEWLHYIVMVEYMGSRYRVITN